MKNTGMKFGICLLSAVPVRNESSDQAEMVTQLIFGELLIIQESKQDWLNIRIVQMTRQTQFFLI